MKQETEWNEAYSRHWHRLFAALPTDTQEQVKAAPSGETSAQLAAQAHDLADKETDDREGK